MRSMRWCAGVLLAATAAMAQMAPPPAGGPPRAPKSPAVVEKATIGGKTLTIAYSSPRVRGREGKIFGKDGLIGHEKNYPVWRAGANQATMLTVDADVKIGEVRVPKGSYTLFVDVADPAQWVLILNKKTGEWGLDYASAEDLGRAPMKTEAAPSLVEELKFTLTDLGGGKGELRLSWEKMTASVPVEVLP